MAKWIDFKRLRGELSFPTVLSHYGITHNASKTQDTILCPFHDETEPSCSINKAKGVFRCFGCGTQGNVLDFVCEMEGLDCADKEALARGAEIAITDILGKSLDDFGRKTKRQRGARKQKPEKGEARAVKPKPAKAGARSSGLDPWEALAAAEQALADLEVSKRKGYLDAAKAKVFAAMDARRATTHGTEPVDHASPATAQTGRRTTAEKANRPLTFALKNLVPEHPFFTRRGLGRDTVKTFGLGLCERGIMKGRIVIPIHNADGELVAYAGRWPDETVPEGTSRYRFPNGFRKGLELFNLHRARERLTGDNALVIVEGFWSVIRLHEEGFAAVAAFGHVLSEQQAALIAAHTDKAILVFDGDEAGRKGMEKAALLLSRHVYTRCLFLADGEKPDTMKLDALRAL